MPTALRLTTGNKYDVTKLSALPVGEWIDPNETIFWRGFARGYSWRGFARGYSYLDWFRDGEYLGPDENGVEPLFEVQ